MSDYHYKLVRDKIKAKIEKDGYEAITKILTKSELKKELREKLVEEANEVFNSEKLVKQNNFTMKEISEQARIKREKFGSFNKGVFLIEVK
jgi:predicted house-cleaning noncanonical NTP pyrophosphatase (MazG superfamily)